MLLLKQTADVDNKKIRKKYDDDDGKAGDDDAAGGDGVVDDNNNLESDMIWINPTSDDNGVLDSNDEDGEQYHRYILLPDHGEWHEGTMSGFVSGNIYQC
jgi:hypothetical protein